MALIITLTNDKNGGSVETMPTELMAGDSILSGKSICLYENLCWMDTSALL